MTPCSVEDINKQGFYVPYDPSTADATPPVPKRGKGGLRDDFMWGFATASAQIEGGGKEKEEASGRGRSVCTYMVRWRESKARRWYADAIDLGHAV